MTDNTTILTVCPHCRRRYRVRSEHVPPQGVRARCPHCGAVFAIVPRIAPASVAAPARPAVPPAPPAPPARPAAQPGAAASAPAPAPAAPAAPKATWSSELEKNRPRRGPIGEIRPRSVQANGRSEPEPPALASGNGASEDEAHANARTLARALASDLAAYYPDLSRKGRDTGRLVGLMAAEISRSWQMYTREVGPEIANSTSYFRDALNECLAGGEEYF